jgi:hypothetical protein
VTLNSNRGLSNEQRVRLKISLLRSRLESKPIKL